MEAGLAGGTGNHMLEPGCYGAGIPGCASHVVPESSCGEKIQPEEARAGTAQRRGILGGQGQLAHLSGPGIGRRRCLPRPIGVVLTCCEVAGTLCTEDGIKVGEGKMGSWFCSPWKVLPLCPHSPFRAAGPDPPSWAQASLGLSFALGEEAARGILLPSAMCPRLFPQRPGNSAAR